MTALEAYLRHHNYSVTRARRVVFDILEQHEPLTMKQLIEAAHGHIDRVSVYRAIELFEKLDIVHRIPIGWKYKLELSERFRQHHHHMSCKACGSIIPINDAKLEKTIATIATQQQFALTSHQVELSGYCQKCRS